MVTRQRPQCVYDPAKNENSLLPEGSFSFDDVYLPEVELRQVPTRIVKGIGKIARAKVPYKIELPQETTDPVPLLLAHGYLGTEDFYAPLRHHIAAAGKPAITYESARVQELLAGLHPKHFLRPERLLSQEVWSVMRDVETRTDTGLQVNQFDLSGHSMGGPTSASVAQAKPEHVRHIILNASAGLEKHNLLKMVRRLPAFHNEEFLPAVLNGEMPFVSDREVVLRALYHIYRNPARTAAEGIAVAGSNIHAMLRSLGGLGIKTALIGYKKDRLCPVENMLRDGGELVDLRHVFPRHEAGHLAPQIYPEEVAYTHLRIISALSREPEHQPQNPFMAQAA